MTLALRQDGDHSRSRPCSACSVCGARYTHYVCARGRSRAASLVAKRRHARGCGRARRRRRPGRERRAAHVGLLLVTALALVAGAHNKSLARTPAKIKTSFNLPRAKAKRSVCAQADETHTAVCTPPNRSRSRTRERPPTGHAFRALNGARHKALN